MGGWKILNCTMIRENENTGEKTIEWKFPPPPPPSLPSLLLSDCKIHSNYTNGKNGISVSYLLFSILGDNAIMNNECVHSEKTG